MLGGYSFLAVRFSAVYALSGMQGIWRHGEIGRSPGQSSGRMVPCELAGTKMTERLRAAAWGSGADFCAHQQ